MCAKILQKTVLCTKKTKKNAVNHFRAFLRYYLLILTAKPIISFPKVLVLVTFAKVNDFSLQCKYYNLRHVQIHESEQKRPISSANESFYA